MAVSAEFDIAKLEPPRGDRVCVLYFGAPDRDKVLLAYLRAGLHAGDSCLLVVDPTDAPVSFASIGTDLRIESFLASGQLELREVNDAGPATDPFSDLINASDQVRGHDGGAGRDALTRGPGDSTRSTEGPRDTETVTREESGLTDSLCRYPQVCLCLRDLDVFLFMYAVQRFDGGMLIDMVKTQPKLMLGGMALENPDYLSPAEFRTTRRQLPQP
jgi:DcmR-like sensory protein